MIPSDRFSINVPYLGQLGNPMTGKQAEYLAFLIRLWREKGMKTWRAILINPHTGEREGFENPQALWKFLDEQIDKVTTGEDES